MDTLSHSSCTTAATEASSFDAPQAQPSQAILDFFFPGFSILTSACQKYFGIDLNVYIPLIILCGGATFAWQYLSDYVWGLIESHLMSSVDVRTDDEIYKSYARLLYHDYLANADNAAFAEVAPELRDMEYETSLTDKVVEKTFMGLTKKKFQERVSPGIQVATLCGNMYCASVWGGLASLIYHVDDAALVGKRVGLFSYGSGLASSFMSFRIESSVAPIQKVLDIRSRLEARRVLSPVDYEA
ncbi:hypothetical protein BN1708_017693, partial [Verticillium longisporum]